MMSISDSRITASISVRIVDANKLELLANVAKEAADIINETSSSYWILIPTYIFILFFAILEYKIKYCNK